MAAIHTFPHRAMGTFFEVRIADEEKTTAAPAAQAALDLLDILEARLSRFRLTSDVARLAHLQPGDTLGLSEPVFACLAVAKKMELGTRGAFSATSAASQARWTLLPEVLSVRCDVGPLLFDFGAIGKGFALDWMAEMLRQWDCPAFLLIAGGSSILAGAAPDGCAGWSCGLGEDDAPQRFWLSHASLSGSGLAVKGSHILDPRTGLAAHRQGRAWALTESAAESDALSTACMVLTDTELEEVLLREPSWLVFLETGQAARVVGSRALPPSA